MGNKIGGKMSTFTETYLKFKKATTFMQVNPDKRVGHQEPFADLCDKLDKLWNKASRAERSSWASELVGQGVNNSVFHYQLYGKAKEQWFVDPFKQ